MRTFLAIEIPSEIQDSIEGQIASFKKEYPQMTWVPTENFHITLFFFGEVDNIEKLKKEIAEIVYDVPSFRLFSQGTDLFLGDRIVLYLSFFKEKILYDLHNRLQEKYNPNKKKEEVPHMTLARYRIPSKQQYLLIKKKIQNLEVEVEFPVKKIYLIESILTGPKPEYKKIAEFNPVDED